MKTNYKIILVTLILCNAVATTFAETPITDNNKNSLIGLQPKSSLIVNTDFHNKNNDAVDKDSKTTVNQLLNRFNERTEYYNTDKIQNQTVEQIQKEISALHNYQLTKDNISNFSSGLLEFITKGSDTYGTIKPDIARKELSNRNITFSDSEIEKSRQNDVNEINARETIQSIEAFYKEIKTMLDNNIPESIIDDIAEVKIIGQKLEKSNNNKAQNELIKLWINQDNNTVKLPHALTKEEINELKQIIKDREILPQKHGNLITKLKGIGNKIKSMFSKKLDSTENEGLNVSNNNTSEMSKDQVAEAIINNSALFAD